MLRKITLPLVTAGFIFVGMFGASDEEIDAHSAAISPTMVPSPSATMTATITPIPFGSASPMETATPMPPDDPNYPKKPHPAPTTTP